MNPPGTKVTKPLSRLKLAFLIVLLAFVLSIALVAWRLLTPPAPFPIPPDLALNYPQDKFDSPDNAWHLYQQLEPMTHQASASPTAWRDPPKRQSWLETDPRSWSADDRTSAQDFVERNAQAISLLGQAVAKPFFVEQPTTLEVKLPHITPAITLAQALATRAALAELRGDETAALRDQRTILGSRLT